MRDNSCPHYTKHLHFEQDLPLTFGARNDTIFGMAPYIIWDWNGTLLNDVDASVDALNHLLSDRGLSPISRTDYRKMFGFPVRPLYVKIGIDPDHDWDQICVDFHRYLSAAPQGLRPDARAALDEAQKAGVGQSILSALRQDFLLRDTGKFGVQDFFDEIYGVDNLDGASKLARAHQLLAQLKARGLLPDGRPLFFIGDTLHDAEVGQALGATVILVDGGHQTADRLAAAGCTVATSLPDAVRLACA